MRWKPMDTRTIPQALEWLLMAILFPVWGPLIAGIWLHEQYRRYVPRPSADWHRWFAWRPVRVWWRDSGDAVVWLETIERRRFYNTMHYRSVGTPDYIDLDEG